jgi:hypothetical protein
MGVMLEPLPLDCSQVKQPLGSLPFAHRWLMKGSFLRLLPLLHTLVEERAGVRRIPPQSFCFQILIL